MKSYLLMFLLTMAIPAANAEEYVYELLELTTDNILVSNDGTGVIKNVECTVCTSRIIKITENTKAYVMGKETDIVAARREYRDRVASIRFNVNTREVETIRW